MSSVAPLISFGVGFLAYVGYFKHSEHHLQGTKYMQTFIIAIIGSTYFQTHYNDLAIKSALNTTLQLSILFLFGVFIPLSIYRLFLNPLNSIPGPYFTRLSKFSTVFRNKNLNAHHQLAALHKKHGRFVRIGPNDISVTHPDGAQVISGLQSKCTKGSWYDGDYPLQSLHTTRDKMLHDKRRRIWAPAFSDKALRGYEKRIKVYNDLLVGQIRAFGGMCSSSLSFFHPILSARFSLSEVLTVGKRQTHGRITMVQLLLLRRNG
jgi:hypothetical protein